MEIVAIAFTLATLHSVNTLNNVNPGVILEGEKIGQCAPIIGAYWNSERHASALAGCRFARDLGAGFEASAQVVGITGYRAMPVTPAVLPSISYRGFSATFLPPPKWVGAQSAVYGVNFSYRFALDLK